MIENVKELKQFMDDGSMLLPEIPVLLRLLQTLGAPEEVDYDYLMSISGSAVRLSWQQGWAAYEGEPNQSGLFADGDRLSLVRNCLERAGVAYQTRFWSRRADTGKMSSPGRWTGSI